MKGRIVVVKEYGKPFEIEEYDVPEPQPGAVLLRMTQAGICGSDLHTWRGDQTQEHLPLPETGRVMGHEGTGVIEYLGDGVTSDYYGTEVKEGDRVDSIPRPASGPTSPAPTAISCICRRAIPSSACRMSCPTASWGRSTAPWAPLPQAWSAPG